MQKIEKVDFFKNPSCNFKNKSSVVSPHFLSPIELCPILSELKRQFGQILTSVARSLFLPLSQWNYSCLETKKILLESNLIFHLIESTIRGKQNQIYCFRIEWITYVCKVWKIEEAIFPAFILYFVDTVNPRK